MSNSPVVFLFDVDNTLLDNDHVTADLQSYLTQHIGADASQEYFAIFEKLRNTLGYADYLGTLQEFRRLHPHTTEIMNVSLFLLDYHFANRLFPNSLDVVQRARAYGPTAILSDGDVVFQPHKIENAGLWEEFQGNVLIYVRKDQELSAVRERFPADHYVMVDDKLRILDSIKQQWGKLVTTVFVRQGHYAHERQHLEGYRQADITLECIGDFLEYSLNQFVNLRS